MLPYLSQRAMLGFQYDPKLKKQLENIEKGGVIFMYVSKAFDTINHSLLLAELKAYRFSDQVLSLLQSYLCNREA